MKYIYFDASSGLSGDMILGALLDLGVAPSLFKKKMAELKLPVDIQIQETKRASLRGLKVTVKVKAKKTTGNINFSLKQGGYITCRVLDPYGYTLSSDPAVYAYNFRGELVSSSYISSFDGRYALNGLPSGKYRVRATYYGEEDYMSEFYDNKLHLTISNPNIDRITVKRVTVSYLDDVIKDITDSGLLSLLSASSWISLMVTW